MTQEREIEREREEGEVDVKPATTEEEADQTTIRPPIEDVPDNVPPSTTGEG